MTSYYSSFSKNSLTNETPKPSKFLPYLSCGVGYFLNSSKLALNTFTFSGNYYLPTF